MNWREALGPELSAEVLWSASDNPLPDGDIARLFNAAENIHKTAHFIEFYERTFRSYRDRPIRMLEIGVACGGSLELWRQYFCPEATVVGVDGNPQCAQFDDPSRNKYVRIGQQQDINFLKQLVEELGPFDIILDDGSHLPSYTLKTFRHMFLHGMNKSGIYLVEDLEWCYMPCGREPFKNEIDCNDGSPTFTNFIKILIDVMHEHYERAQPENTDAFQAEHPDRMSAVTVPLITTLIDQIDLSDGIVAIHKKPRDLPRLLFKTGEEFLKQWLAAD